MAYRMAYLWLLKPTEEASRFLSSTDLHPTYFPYKLVLILHAVRISHIFSTRVKAAGHRLPPLQHIAGFLVFAWGGAILTNILLCTPPRQLYDPAPWIIYVSTHLFMNLLFAFFPWPSGRFMDSVFPLIDAIGRSKAIMGSVEAVRRHPNPEIAGSLFAQLVVGAVASAGGGALAGFLGVMDKEWSVKTPAVLKGGLIPTMDFWAGALAAAIHGVVTYSHPAYSPINTFLIGKPKKFRSDIGAGNAVVLFLTANYIIRTVYMHYLPSRAAKPVTVSQKRAIKPVTKEKKSQ